MRDGGAKSDESREVPPPRVICRKSVDLLDYKGVDFFGSDQEFVRVSE